MIARSVIAVLCGVGLYTALFMLNKDRRAARGEVRGPSVVKTPRAHLYGVPNALLGVIYYPALALAVWLLHARWEMAIVLLAALFAAATSAVLAYSLLFITRRECPFCWTAHAVNWSLLVLCAWLFGQPA
ncbi:MAG: vitamin K epoxide reductase family protein [Candidatus Eremiobacteraeota bacterium]|nr:vitamin K epoxide reductase family protein [Candidatus Eremiobacteraeota bacterium]MBV9055487.1 vitamin K epoxide reductase family protein [Candidatus Eremiobacteraeota bacterium]MBV9699065.1 vitamin K epoxide reductase family protein [Candidatus Eremiobacteraeota bacterium]